MAYADMTPGDQADTQVYVNLGRAAARQLRKAINQLRGFTNVADLQGNALLNQLVAGDTIPDTSGLAGSQDVTKSNVNSFRDDCLAILATYDETTKNNIMIKLIGSANFADGGG